MFYINSWKYSGVNLRKFLELYRTYRRGWQKYEKFLSCTFSTRQLAHAYIYLLIFIHIIRTFVLEANPIFSLTNIRNKNHRKVEKDQIYVCG